MQVSLPQLSCPLFFLLLPYLHAVLSLTFVITLPKLSLIFFVPCSPSATSEERDISQLSGRDAYKTPFLKGLCHYSKLHCKVVAFTKNQTWSPA